MFYNHQDTPRKTNNFLYFFLLFSTAFVNFNFLINSLYLFLMVTSVTPATSATSRCVLFSPCNKLETYKAAAAIPVGPLPEVSSISRAISKISTAFDCVSGLNFKADAKRG